MIVLTMLMASSTLNNGFDNCVPKLPSSLSERYVEMPGFGVRSYPVEVRILRLSCPVTIKSTNHRNPPLSYLLPSLCIQRLHSCIDINTACEVGRWTSISTGHTRRLDRSIHSPTTGQIIYWACSMPQRYSRIARFPHTISPPSKSPGTPTHRRASVNTYVSTFSMFRCRKCRGMGYL